MQIQSKKHQKSVDMRHVPGFWVVYSLTEANDKHKIKVRRSLCQTSCGPFYQRYWNHTIQMITTTVSFIIYGCSLTVSFVMVLLCYCSSLKAGESFFTALLCHNCLNNRNKMCTPQNSLRMCALNRHPMHIWRLVTICDSINMENNRDCPFQNAMIRINRQLAVVVSTNRWYAIWNTKCTTGSRLTTLITLLN